MLQKNLLPATGESAIVFVTVAVLLLLAAPARAVEPSYLIPPTHEFRTIDGSGNNPHHPDWGAASLPVMRYCPNAYMDGASVPPTHYPGPREISNAVAAQTRSRSDPGAASGFLWQWGQFLDHDIDLTPKQNPREPLPIAVPTGDPQFDPEGNGGVEIRFFRSKYTVMLGVREQMNTITAFIDASNVYGSDEARAAELQTLDGTGGLRTSPGDLLPYNGNGFPNDPDPNDPTLFLAGDVRANEQIGLTALHTLFVREHNYQARRLRATHPMASGDEIYEMARAVVGAEMQAITYREFLPKLLGPEPLIPYTGYRPNVNPGIRSEFSSAVYRLGHSMLPPRLLRLDPDLTAAPAGHIALRDAFFVPAEIEAGGGLDPLLRGLAHQPCQAVDTFVVDEVRNFLFGEPEAGGFDLVALNIQRGRDHGLPRYNAARKDVGLSPKKSFAEISSDPEIQARLEAVYESVEDIDLWVGALAEDHLPGALVGELTHLVLMKQFQVLRDGDRFWYEGSMQETWIDYVESQTLAVIIRRNTDIGYEIPDDAFAAPGILAADEPLPVAFSPLALSAPFPNPLREVSTAVLTLSPDSVEPVRVAVFDVRGRLLRTLVNRPLGPGEHLVRWDGRDDRGREATSGVYFLRAESGLYENSKRVLKLN